MNIQKQVVSQLLRDIVKLEQQLEAIRQLLNQELTFTFTSTYSYLIAGEKTINLFSLKKFLLNAGSQNLGISDKGVENMIKFYSNGHLQLGIKEWKTILLSREDRLLAKLASERENSQQELPQFIISYCKKVILKEAQIHTAISTLMLKFPLSSEQIQSVCSQILQYFDQDSVYFLKRYLSQGYLAQSEDFLIQSINKILSLARTNAKQITEYLQAKEQEFLQKENNKRRSNDPLVHKEFKKLGTIEKAKFIPRQAKSIQKHLYRNNSPSSAKIIQKIEAFTYNLERQLNVFFKILRKILRLNNQIIERKVQFLSTSEGSFSLLFNQIARKNEIIPSQLQHYLRTLNIKISLESLFLLFKRNCDLTTGKMNKKQFTHIFQLSDPSITLLNAVKSINQSFRINTALCILNEIDYESQIQQLKRMLMDKVDLRLIFQAIDVGNKRRISLTDLKVIYRKLEGKNLKQKLAIQFWWRMKAAADDTIDYDTFMYELIPRTKSIPLN